MDKIKYEFPDGTKQLKIKPIINGVKGRWIKCFPNVLGEVLIVADNKVFDIDLNEIKFPPISNGKNIKIGIVQRALNGDYIVAEIRNNGIVPNCFIFDKNRTFKAMFRIGDAVEKLLVDKDYNIWVGYFDEGVFGHDQLSTNGLNCFDQNGKLIANYWGNKDAQLQDVYNINISDEGAVYIFTDTCDKIVEVRNRNFAIVEDKSPAGSPNVLMITDKYYLKLGTGYRKGDPYQTLEDGVYTSLNLKTGETYTSPNSELLDENDYEIYKTCITIIDRNSREPQLVQVLDENAATMPMKYGEVYKDKAYYVVNNNIYEITASQILNALNLP